MNSLGTTLVNVQLHVALHHIGHTKLFMFLRDTVSKMQGLWHLHIVPLTSNAVSGSYRSISSQLLYHKNKTLRELTTGSFFVAQKQVGL